MNSNFYCAFVGYQNFSYMSCYYYSICPSKSSKGCSHW
ncbi:hypothetical protein IHE45_19G076800 [Dioscorea alata]|uniref:Uncharacterized protein n=1 Tax=Dioscorea alata TaxID=55571 RepID=A0ACB7TZ69_DIOAL|nr:hypothetical protein IHE45_19G076800 [Dioscorea alata]